MLLLDTHAAIWMAESQPISEAGRLAIHSALAEKQLLFSAVSAWEIGLLMKRSRLRLSVSLDEWLEKMAARPGVQFVDLDITAAAHSTQLPEPFVQDPADRFLVPTARTLTVPLLTRDKRILAYASAGHVKAVKC